MKVKEILSSPVWFLIAGILFLLAGVRLFLQDDLMGGIIYITASVLFNIGCLGHMKFNKKR